MKSLEVCVFLMVLSQVKTTSALTCANTLIGGLLDTCTAKTGEMCGKLSYVTPMGQFTKYYCRKSAVPVCTDYYFCNDKNDCNHDTSDVKVFSGVSSVKCQCGSNQRMLMNESLLPNQMQCNANGECLSKAGDSQTAACFTAKMAFGVIVKGCSDFSPNEPLFSYGTECFCNDHNMCNAPPLVCDQTLENGDQGECTAGPGEMCARSEITTADGNMHVKLSCSQSKVAECAQMYFCNDEDNCNANETDTTVVPKVTSRKCMCTGDQKMSDHDFISLVSNRKGTVSPPCVNDGCDVNVENSHTALCAIGVSTTGGQKISSQRCMDLDSATPSGLPTKISMCTCKTNKCNKKENPSAASLKATSVFGIVTSLALTILSH